MDSPNTFSLGSAACTASSLSHEMRRTEFWAIDSQDVKLCKIRQRDAAWEIAGR